MGIMTSALLKMGSLKKNLSYDVYELIRYALSIHKYVQKHMIEICSTQLSRMSLLLHFQNTFHTKGWEKSRIIF